MARVDEYREIICKFLQDFAEDDPEAKLIFDTQRDRYLVMHMGWRKEDRIYGCAMQIDLIEEQVWLQHNSTEIYIDRELIERGIPKTAIIFGFRSPSIREYLAKLSDK